MPAGWLRNGSALCSGGLEFGLSGWCGGLAWVIGSCIVIGSWAWFVGAWLVLRTGWAWGFWWAVSFLMRIKILTQRLPFPIFFCIGRVICRLIEKYGSIGNGNQISRVFSHREWHDECNLFVVYYYLFV